MDDEPVTQKLLAVSRETELEHYQNLFNEAGRKMLAHPTKENIKAYGDAQKKLQEVEDAYRQGYRGLLSRLQTSS